jgi:hypothetical protein
MCEVLMLVQMLQLESKIRIFLKMLKEKFGSKSSRMMGVSALTLPAPKMDTVSPNKIDLPRRRSLLRKVAAVPRHAVHTNDLSMLTSITDDQSFSHIEDDISHRELESVHSMPVSMFGGTVDIDTEDELSWFQDVIGVKTLDIRFMSEYDLVPILLDLTMY